MPTLKERRLARYLNRQERANRRRYKKKNRAERITARQMKV